MVLKQQCWNSPNFIKNFLQLLLEWRYLIKLLKQVICSQITSPYLKKDRKIFVRSFLNAATNTCIWWLLESFYFKENWGLAELERANPILEFFENCSEQSRKLGRFKSENSICTQHFNGLVYYSKKYRIGFKLK